MILALALILLFHYSETKHYTLVSSSYFFYFIFCYFTLLIF